MQYTQACKSDHYVQNNRDICYFKRKGTRVQLNSLAGIIISIYIIIIVAISYNTGGS